MTKHAHWELSRLFCTTTFYECTNCGFEIMEEGELPETCYECGAIMDEMEE